MFYDGIEAFLEIHRSGTFSRAAETLHITQSTISRRIKQLEQELGSPLITRKKGERKVYLTAFGEKFITIAERWKVLLQDTHQLQTNDNIKITVGAVDSLSTYLLPPFYLELYNQPVNLRVRNHPSTELYALVQQRDIDFAFVHHESIVPNVAVKPFFKEKMVVLRPGSAEMTQKKMVTPAELDPAKELFIPWNPINSAWHDRLWDPFYAKRLYVDSAPLLLLMFSQFTDNNMWAIVPNSIALFCQQKFSCTIQYLSDPPPDRICYQITPSQNKMELSDKLTIIDLCIQKTLLPYLYQNEFDVFTQHVNTCEDCPE